MIQNPSEVQVSQAAIGNMCASQIKIDYGRELLIVVVYLYFI